MNSKNRKQKAKIVIANAVKQSPKINRDCFIRSSLAMALVFFNAIAFSQTDSIKTIETKDVIINAVKSSEKDPHTQTTISQKELSERNTGKDLPYLIDNQPSVVVTSDAGAGTGYTNMRVRGSDITKINVTINGIPVNDAESQVTYFVDVPDLAATSNSVQLQRGVGASTNGAGAFGASLNIQNNGFSTKPYGYFSTHYGSFNTWRHNLRGGSGLIKNKFFLEGSVSRVSSDGYVERAKSDLWSYYMQAGLLLKKTKIQIVHFSGFEKTYQAWNGLDTATLALNRRTNTAGTESNPPYANQIDNYRQHYLQLFVNHSFNEKWSLSAAGFATFGKGYYEEYKADQKLAKYQIVPSDTTLTRSDIVRRRWLDNVYYGGLMGVNYATQKWDVKFGGMIAQYDGKHFGNAIWCKDCEESEVDKNKRYYFSTGLKRDYNVYAKANYSPAKWLVLYGDLQYRYVQHLIKGNNNDLVSFDINKQYHFFNPKAGLKFLIKKQHQLYASFAIANREPARDEQIDNQTNPIKPERLYDTEVGYKFSHSRVSVDVTGFFMYYKNQLLLSGALNDVGNPIKINTPKSFRTGIELLAGAALWQTKKDKRNLLAANFNIAYSLNRIIDFDDRVPVYDADYNFVEYAVTHHKTSTISFSPSWVGGFTLSTEPVKNFQAKVFVKYISKQYLDNTQSAARALPSYAYGDISLSYLFPLKGNKSLRFSATVFNFWNQKYLSNGWTYSERYADAGAVSSPYSYNYYFPQAGIHASGGVEVNF